MNQITCPNCNHQFDVENVIAGKLEQKYQQKLASERKKFEHSFQEKAGQLQERETLFEEKRKQQNELFQQRLEKESAAIKKKLTKELSVKTKQEFRLRMESLERENETKAKLVLQLQQQEVQFLEQQKLMNEEREKMQLEIKRQVLTQSVQVEAKAREKERESQELKMKEYEKKLEDQHKLIEEMKRKSEQGSMQLQGEVQELVIEEKLASMFPFDEIIEVKKGARGADCVQIVRNRLAQQCGKILYESKRTKTFSRPWIEKLKQDQSTEGADIAVLITDAMPDGQRNISNVDGIWVCSFADFQGLALVLRQNILKVHQALAGQQNKGDKMNMLYNYLTGNEFRLQIEAIIEGFSAMKEGIDREKRAMTKIWKEREKQLEKVLLNTTNFYGSVKGIAGNAVPVIPLLELSTDEDTLL